MSAGILKLISKSVERLTGQIHLGKKVGTSPPNSFTYIYRHADEQLDQFIQNK
ncbi:MAG: hypothetical protein WA919_04800 [Coleofasciculaceae cyanobacterium]